ncbi:MAG: cysteine desulfurase-like protein [Bacillota bacterium]|nr:cysteine desulfurase-like protein [Bacillota bacterium]
MNYDVNYVRNQFPALALKVNGYPAAYLDGPGGTQVPQRVIDAVVNYLVKCNANSGGFFKTSMESDNIINNARAALADFLGSDPDEIAFGQNTTNLMYQLAFALGRNPGKRKEIIITEIDHEANRGPWLALEEKGFVVREVKINPENCTLDMEDYRSKLSENTLVAAFNYASNGVGTVSDVKEMVRLAHEAGALAVVDAVHYALHGPIDVKDLGVDFLLCSAYKFFGPHLGVLYGRRDQFEKLPAYKLRVQYDKIPCKIETGTLNHEGIAGAAEAVEFIADLGNKFGSILNPEPAELSAKQNNRREMVIAGMKVMEQYEQPLAGKLINNLSQVNGVKVYGPPQGHPRTSTVSFSLKGLTAEKIAKDLGEKGIFVWDGHFYAIRLVERLGLIPLGGLVRIGLSPYNTEGEIDRLVDEVYKMAKGSS